MNKVISLSGEYFYISELADPFKGGWLSTDLSEDIWLPFVFWKVKHNYKEVPASQDEVSAYKRHLEEK